MRRISPFLILFLFSICSWGQQRDSLVIGPGDTVHIQILEAPELEQHTRVNDSGEVNLILGGNVKISGLPTSEAAHVVEQKLIAGNFILHPHAAVSIEKNATQNVSVLGQVRNPGSYSISTPRSVLDVLALAGGQTDLADRTLTIQRHGTKENVEYTLSNNASKAFQDNVMVFPGDVLVVPKVGVVYVLGDVHRPGGFAMTTNDSRLTILQAVSLAGSTTPSAVPSHARLIRKQADGTYIEMSLNVSAMQKGKRGDMLMKADDILYIPFSYIRNMGSSLGGLLSAAAAASVYRF